MVSGFFCLFLLPLWLIAVLVSSLHQAPLEVLLLLCIPIVDPDKEDRNWRRPLNCLHLITAPLVCLLTFQSGECTSLVLWVCCCLLCEQQLSNDLLASVMYQCRFQPIRNSAGSKQCLCAVCNINVGCLQPLHFNCPLEMKIYILSACF